jgi:hypothetical protein
LKYAVFKITSKGGEKLDVEGSCQNMCVREYKCGEIIYYEYPIPENPGKRTLTMEPTGCLTWLFHLQHLYSVE